VGDSPAWITSLFLELVSCPTKPCLSTSTVDLSGHFVTSLWATASPTTPVAFIQLYIHR
jgi:hypothetical protein